jgi:uncharacterized protein (TIGR02271 family)
VLLSRRPDAAVIPVNTDPTSGEPIPLAREELHVSKKEVETGRVRISTRVEETTALIEEELAREDVQAEWVEVNREVDAVPEVRTEGDTLIIPLFEEVLVVEKRLVLRKELRLTRRMTTRPYQAEVPLRRMHADIERPETNPATQELPMRTLTAFYDSRDHAERARLQLINAGVPADDVDIAAADTAGGTSSQGKEGGGFLQGVKNFFMPEDDRHAYREGMSRGGVLLTARVSEGQETRAIEILDASDAVDLESRQEEWRRAGWTGGREQRLGSDASEDVTIPIAEERLAVGKREVDRGTVRVRSYVVEEPVHEQVALREEQVNIERRPVNERMAGGGADRLFEERSFEVSERAEEAVVGKETVVTDELHVSKDTTERTEDIDDTVRRTEVDVDDERGRMTRNKGSDDRPRGL